MLQSALPFVGVIGGLVGFFIALHRYNQGQIWKRSEFLANEMRIFSSDPQTAAALRMLVYVNNVKVKLYPEHPEYEKRFVHMNAKLLIRALRGHDPDGKVPFTDEELSIRYSVDVLLVYLTRFQSWLDAGLLKVHDLRPYIGYYVHKLAVTKRENGKPHRVNEQLHRYINSYGDKSVLKLFHKFGYKITLVPAPEPPKGPHTTPP